MGAPGGQSQPGRPLPAVTAVLQAHHGPPMAPSFLGAQGWSSGWLSVHQDVWDPQSLNQKESETPLLIGGRKTFSRRNFLSHF